MTDAIPAEIVHAFLDYLAVEHGVTFKDFEVSFGEDPVVVEDRMHWVPTNDFSIVITAVLPSIEVARASARPDGGHGGGRG